MLAVISLIRTNELQRFRRIDAEYYQPIFLQYCHKLQSINSIKLGKRDYARITDGIHTAIDYDSNSGIRCLSAQSVKKGYFDLSANAFISTKQHNQNLRTSLKADEVLISSIGTIGNCAVVTDKILPANTDRNVGHIRTTNKLNPHYLCAFLLSKYGRFQTERESTGNVQKALFIDKIKEILVPILPEQEEIANKMKQARTSLLNSEKMFLNAQNALLSLLGFTEIEIKNVLTYLAPYTLTRISHRIDAEYYQPKYDLILSKIKAFRGGYSKLIEKAPLSKVKINPEETLDEKFTYIELADVNESFGTIDEFTVFSGKSMPSRARMLLQTGDVIASSVKGSLNKVALVTQQFNNAIGSTGFFVFRPKPDILKGFLLKLVKSLIVKLQFEREATGTVLTSIPKTAVKKIIIPNLPREEQVPIDKMVVESNKLRNQAKLLIEEAIENVEKTIERYSLE